MNADELVCEKRKQDESRNGDIRAEPADDVDRAGITAFPNMRSLQPARQLRQSSIHGVCLLGTAFNENFKNFAEFSKRLACELQSMRPSD